MGTGRRPTPGESMRRADRLFEIIQHLRRRPTVRARDLGEALEVSERTIYRDIRDLMAAACRSRARPASATCCAPGSTCRP